MVCACRVLDALFFFFADAGGSAHVFEVLSAMRQMRSVLVFEVLAAMRQTFCACQVRKASALFPCCRCKAVWSVCTEQAMWVESSSASYVDRPFDREG